MVDFAKLLAAKAAAPAPTFSPLQAEALEAGLRGENLFITGPGGTGKSFLVQHLIQALRDAGKMVAVTSSTGVSAVQIGGLTIHTTLGLGIAARRSEAVKRMGADTLQRAQDRLGHIDVLVVDEVSMLLGDYIEMMNWWLNLVKDKSEMSQEPFGGMQVIFVGDFLQLPPVITENELRHVEHKYAFQAPAWQAGHIRPIYLTECFRQGDAEFFKHLNRIRRGVVNDETQEYFEPCVKRRLEVEPTKLVATNAVAEDINYTRLMKLEGPSFTSEAKFSGNEKWYDMLRKNCIAQDTVEIRRGAPVIFLKNNKEMGYFNGQRGTVMGWHGTDCVEVVTSGGRTIQVEREAWELKNADNRLLAKLTQIPLKLAWAITVHKSQGMTLDPVSVDLSGTFERGQGYVALSRARSLEGLSLATHLRQSQIRASKLIVQFYRDLRNGGGG